MATTIKKDNKTLKWIRTSYKKRFGNSVEQYKITKTIPTTPKKRHAFLIALAHACADEMGLFIFAAEQYIADIFKPEKKAKLIVELFLKSDAKKQINSSKKNIEPTIAALLLGDSDEAEKRLQVLINEQILSIFNTATESDSFKKMLESQSQPDDSFVKAIQDLKTPLQNGGFDTYLMGVW